MSFFRRKNEKGNASNQLLTLIKLEIVIDVNEKIWIIGASNV